MDEFVPTLVAIGLIVSLANAGKMAAAGQWNKVGTLLYVYLIGIGVAFLMANAMVTADLEVAGRTLAELDVLSTILFGISISGAGATAYDALPINTPTLGSDHPTE